MCLVYWKAELDHKGFKTWMEQLCRDKKNTHQERQGQIKEAKTQAEINAYKSQLRAQALAELEAEKSRLRADFANASASAADEKMEDASED